MSQLFGEYYNSGFLLSHLTIFSDLGLSCEICMGGSEERWEGSTHTSPEGLALTKREVALNFVPFVNPYTC